MISFLTSAVAVRSLTLTEGSELTFQDGILNVEFAKLLAQGTGTQHGIDSSASMIETARELSKEFSNTTFEGPSPPSHHIPLYM